MQANGSGFRGCNSTVRLGFLLWLFFAAVSVAIAQEQEVPDGTPIERVEIEGLTTISEGFVRRTIKTRAGQNFQLRQAREDARELLRTRKFINALVSARLENGRAVIVFRVREKATIAALEIEGNKRFSDVDLFAEAPAAGDVLDRYDVNRGRENILRKYQTAGYYYAQVTLDERALRDQGRVIYRVTEGPRVKVRKIRLEGVRSFAQFRVRQRVRTQTSLWILRTGAFDEEQADRDATEIQRLYRQEGYLDARAGYRLEFDSVERSNLTVVFVIEEGDRYRVHEIAIAGNAAFDADQLRAAMRLTPGSVLREESLRADVRHIQDKYGEIGYVAARINADHEFLEEPGIVRLRYSIVENVHSKFGRITIRGNPHTKDEVVRRELRFFPGEDYNTLKTRRAEQRLRETGLFSRATITPLDDLDGFREAVIEVEEARTVNFIIGFGISTDSGVLGTLTIENQNFDLFDWPVNSREFFSGQAFRGDGQRLRFQAEPGSEITRFRIDFTEPYLLDRPLRLDSSLYLFQRGREAYSEQRLGGVASLSKRFASGRLEGWAIEGALRLEQIKINNLDPLAPNDIRDARGDSFLSSVKGSIVRDTTDSRLLPTEGYRLSFSWEQVGALGGDFDFSRPSIGFTWFKTLRTDVFDRKSVLGVRADASFIVGDAPVFERFYGGGFGSIRGFDFRGISPRAGILDSRIGGDFILLTGAEYSFPLYGKNVRGVTFLDMGTVEENFEITSWRASVGFGARVTIPFFGPVPFVFDFGFPIARDEDDDTRVFNFSFGTAF